MNTSVGKSVINPLISVSELVGIQEPVIVVDCRHDLMDHQAGVRAYAEGHLPGAAFLGIETDLSALKTGQNGRHPLPTPQAFAALLATLGANERTLIVGYDASGGMYASRLWWMCRWIGHLKCAVLNGGIQQWVAQGGPLSTEPFKAKSIGKIIARTSLCPTWNIAHVSAWVSAGSEPGVACLLDARAPERFEGKTEPLDPVAGHIPGAISRPFAQNLDTDGCFKPASRLREEFLGILGDRDPMSVVHMCGSGVTACHNILAMEVAGLAGSALYPGSWSEWCADASRPVATGP